MTPSYAFVVLDFSDDLDAAPLLAQHLANVSNILSRSNERSENDVDPLLDAESEILAVLLAQCRQIHHCSRQIHTFLRTCSQITEISTSISMSISISYIWLHDISPQH